MNVTSYTEEVMFLSSRLTNKFGFKTNVDNSCVVNPFMPTGAFNICCPRDCVSRLNGVTSGAPLKPLRDDSVLRALSSLRQSLGQ